MKLLPILVISLFTSIANAQQVNLAPSLDGYQNGVYVMPVDGWKAPNWPSINKVASFTDGSLHLQSASALSGGAKSTAPKAYPLKPKWSAYEQIATGNYLASWTVTMTCPVTGEKAMNQAVQLDVGPMKTLTHYSLFQNGVPRDFSQTFSYTRLYANESIYFTFGLDGNPPKDANGDIQYGCKYSLSNLSLYAI